MGCNPFGGGKGGMGGFLPGMPGMGGGGGGLPGMGGGSGSGNRPPGFGDLFGDPGNPHVFKSDVLYFDPLGPTTKGNFRPAAGGPEQRAQIMTDLGANRTAILNATNNSRRALNKAAVDPGWREGADLARAQIRGDYLAGSPQLDAAMAGVRAAENREFGDAAANVRDQYARSGVGFGTANQQAEQAARAAASARASGVESAARLQNYQTERGIQQESPNLLHNTLGRPVDYLSQIPAAITGPQTQLAQIVKGLFGQGQIQVQPQDIVEDPGMLGQIFGTVGRL